MAIVKYTAADGSEMALTLENIARYVVTGGAPASDRDIMAFMAKCKARRLNPFAGDAYMTCYRNRDGSTSSSVIVSKDYYTRTATEQPGYDGMEAGVVVVNRDGRMEYRTGALVGRETERLVGGWAKVYDKGRSHPSVAVVGMDEYDQGRSLWKSKPATMIRKVAVVQALREAYPAAFAGLYDAGEMPEGPKPEPQEDKEPQEDDGPQLEEQAEEMYEQDVEF